MDAPAARPALQVAALYRFARFDDPRALRAPLLDLCQEEGICGILLLAPEGINGTIAGRPDGVARVLAHIRALPGCADVDVKYSTAADMPFGKMRVRLKREIVTMGVGDLDPAANAGVHVDPRDWNALIADPDVVLIDTRNEYEIGVGGFAGALDPGATSFGEFPAWFDALAGQWERQGRRPKIAMFCTGGIRCEKSTAYARSRGFDEVYHLKGGVLRYLEEVPQDQSRWTGDCFVFDRRVAVTHGLAPGSHVMCLACGRPVKPEAMAAHKAGCKGGQPKAERPEG